MKVSHRHFHAEASLVLTALFSLLLLTGLVVPAAAAPVTWDLTGVTFGDGGGATGWFTYDASSSMKITDWNITSTFGQPPHPPNFFVQNPETFTPADSVAYYVTLVNNTAIIEFDTIPRCVDNTTVCYFLDIGITPLLDSATSPLPIITNLVMGAQVSEYGAHWPDIVSDYRITAVTGGQLTTSVPEPISLLLLGSGLVGLVGFRRKFRK